MLFVIARSSELLLFMSERFRRDCGASQMSLGSKSDVSWSSVSEGADAALVNAPWDVTSLTKPNTLRIESRILFAVVIDVVVAVVVVALVLFDELFTV